MKKLITYTMGLLLTASLGISSAFALALPTYHDYSQKGKTGVTVEFLDENGDSLYLDIDLRNDVQFVDRNGDGVIEAGDEGGYIVVVGDSITQ